MKNAEKIFQFVLPGIEPEIILTHGYGIENNFPVHFHKTFSLGIIESGKRELTVRGTKYIIKKGDVFVIQPFEPHSINAVDDMEHTYKIISFDFCEISSSYYPELVIKDRSLFELIELFHDHCEYNYSNKTVLDKLTEIKKVLSRYTLPLMECKPPFAEAINKAKTFIENNCTRQISVDEIASEACLSTYHFTRLFHKETGMSPYAFLIHCRVRVSLDKLEQNDLNVAAALDSGFFDQSHFIKTFKKHVGVTPGKFSNKHNKTIVCESNNDGKSL